MTNAAPDPTLPRTYAHIPPQVRRPPPAVRVGYRLVGGLLAALNWLRAHRLDTPGLNFHPRCARLALKTLTQRPGLEARWLLHMLFSPMVLTRYFEFDFVWCNLPSQPVERYLDVSSPFMLPIVLMSERRAAHADFINPDRNDQALIRQHIVACALTDTCTLHPCLIGDAPFGDRTFDLITSISVIEHIPDDREAIGKIWSLLKPGGRLILTLPCAAQGYALFTDVDHYGLLGSNERGFTFLEYIYDAPLLEAHIYSITGPPARTELYGERHNGTLRAELLRRWSGEYWRFWREPTWMGKHFRRFDALDQLPGEGVIALMFVKS